MLPVLLTALGIGGSTLLGALLGFVFRKIPHKWNDAISGFAAGVMLAAAVLGLILPAVEMSGTSKVWMVVAGILAGAVFLNMMDKLTPHLHRISGVDIEQHNGNGSIGKVMLFVMAIALHNFPEGLAAGVSFGSGDIESALTVTLGIALQNVPEGLVIIAPLLLAGVTPKRTLFIASMTGLVEVIGTFVGFFAASVSAMILPFALAFAGGTMLYVVSDEMIPETHGHGNERLATYSLLIGFIVMLLMDTMI
ncbi:MAG: ZIP family metal transporter [Clostridia bacterium]|nr:ZIP family metal transporter [Clostridia bacterium]MBQ4085128.1 ZIP family metal transporter [Clostridia bacterium]